MKISYGILLALSVIIMSCTGSTNEVTFHESHESKKQSAPFSDAVQVGDIYFLSGQIGMDHSTRELVTGGIEAETKQTLENIKAVLKHHDLEMKDVVKSTVILADINDFKTFNEIYKTYFPQKPARTTFAAKGLARGAKIEIECVAARSK
ncbi:RidA family protein [Aquimarina rhabdastrellae]